MKIVEQEAVYLPHEGDPYEFIEDVGRTCYKSEKRGNPIGFVKGLKKSGHLAMLEHEYVYFRLDEKAMDYFQHDIVEFWEVKYLNIEENHISGSFRAFIELFELYDNGCGSMIMNPEENVIAEMARQLSKKYPDLFEYYDIPHLKSEYGEVTLISREELISDFKNNGETSLFDEMFLSTLLPHTFRFITNRGCCYDNQTQVLTDDGFKFFRDLTINDKILSLDDNNNLEYIKPIKYIKEQYNGDMHYWHSTQIDCMVTPNHNMWLFDYNKKSSNSRTWKFIESQDATNKAYMFNKTSNGISNIGYKTFILPATTRNHAYNSIRKFPSIELQNANLFFELIGLWITDGCLSYGSNNSGNKIIITQKKIKIRSRIKYLLGQLHIKYRIRNECFNISCPQLFSWLEENFIRPGDNKKSYYLTLPRWIFNFLSKKNMEYLLKGIIEGDGTPHTKGKGYQIYTASESFAKDLVELSLFIGKAANYYEIQPRDRVFPNSNKITHCKKQYVVSIIVTGEHLFRKNNKTNKDVVKYDGYIYCVELPKYHRLYVIRNGKGCWCGNSHELVRHRPASFAQESQRYIGYDKEKFGSEITVIKPLLDSESKDYEEWKYAMDWCETVYMNLRERGVAPQIARGVLPNDCKTEIVVTATEEEWQHIVDLRYHGTTGAPHPQIKELIGLAYPVLVEKSEGRVS